MGPMHIYIYMYYIYILDTVYNGDCHIFPPLCGRPQSERSVLRKLVTQGRAESFRLAVPTESNGRVAGANR